LQLLLVNTNRMKPAIAPIGLDYLADALTAAGHTPRLLDLCFAEDLAADIERAVRDSAPDIIGVTIRNTDDCYFSSQAFFLPEAKRAIELLRRVSAAPIVLGGVGFSVAPAAALDYCGADFGIAGEGEVALLELVRALESGAGFADVSSLVYRNGDSIRQNPQRPLNLSALPPRRRTFVDNPRYFRQGGQAGFETKRGCPMACVYCADPVSKGRSLRLLPPARVLAELTALVGQGIDHFHTCDSEFNLPPDHARAVCQAIIEAGLGERIRWYAYCSPAPFDEDMAALFQRAGGAGINFGVDSGADQVLRSLGRHFTTDDLARTAQLCRRRRLPFMYDLLIGGPGETRASVRQTIDFMRALEPDCVGLSLGLRVYDRTPVAAQLRAAGGLAQHPNLYGAKLDNPGLLKPVFYIAPELGDGLTAYVQELVAGDPRFFLPTDSSQNRNYNYNDNTVLTRAIEGGARGAYWDILRRLRPA
jgi:radical SAM superfamily enzyme YgiQ (UPF0313 family)